MSQERIVQFEKWIVDTCPENVWGDPDNTYEWPLSEATALSEALAADGWRIVKLRSESCEARIHEQDWFEIEDEL